MNIEQYALWMTILGHFGWIMGCVMSVLAQHDAYYRTNYTQIMSWAVCSPVWTAMAIMTALFYRGVL